MHKFIPALLLSLVATAALTATTPVDPAKMLATAPLRFEPSKAGDGEFVTRGLRFQAAMSKNQLALEADGESMRLRFAGALDSATLVSGEQLKSRTNVLHGNDRSQWRTGISNYKDLSIASLYPGIGLHYYGTGGQLEYDLIVAPGADPKQVRMRFDGVQPKIDTDGNLTAVFLQKRPVAYQMLSGNRVPVESRYARNADGSFGIRLGTYDRKQELTIDPVLTFSAYLSGTTQDIAYGIGRDAKGLLYVAGTTAATDFTSAGNPKQVAAAGSFDLFVAVLDPTPNAATPILYSTYLGGTLADNMKAMAVSPAGLVYMTGLTASTDFPMAGTPLQTTLNGTTDAFVVVLDPSQASDIALVYSTYLGGALDDTGYAIAFGTNGWIYVAGDTRSIDFPTNNPYSASLSGNEDMWVTVIDPNRSSSIFGTYFGDAGTEFARGIAVLSDKTFWLTGGTYSKNFPLNGNPYSFAYKGGGDVFLAKFDPVAGGASALQYATFLGGSGNDVAQTLTVDPSGRLVISGYTTSADFPVTADAVQPTFGGVMDAFVSILDPKLPAPNQLVYSTYYGGKSFEVPTALKLDANGVIHLVGYTSSSNLPVTADAFQKNSLGGYEGFYAKINPTTGMDYSTYIGGTGTQILYGVEVDSNTNVYVAGYTTSAIFDALGGVAKSTAPGDADAFVMGLSPCGYTLSASSAQISADGGTIGLALTGGKDCSWTISNPYNFIKASPASGNGNANISLTVSANATGKSRTVTILIAGLPFVISQ